MEETHEGRIEMREESVQNMQKLIKLICLLNAALHTKNPRKRNQVSYLPLNNTQLLICNLFCILSISCIFRDVSKNIKNFLYTIFLASEKTTYIFPV